MRFNFTLSTNPQHLQDLMAALPGAREYFSSRERDETATSIGVSGSMFRVFGGIEKPSLAYQSWAFAQIRSKKFECEVLSLKTQGQFDNLHSALADSLSNHWKDKTEQALILTYKLKLLDLFIKRACQLELPSPGMNDILLLFGHVPLDKLVFNALDEIFSSVLLLAGRAMGHIKTEQAYSFYQVLIRELMAELDSPALYFDYYAWNLRRSLAEAERAERFGAASSDVFERRKSALR
jgi:hypothetical protein